MAAKVPTTILRQNLGSVNLIIARFDGTVSSNDIDNADTWASGLGTSIVGTPWFAPTSATNTGVSVTGNSSGTLTFGSPAAGMTGDLYVLVAAL